MTSRILGLGGLDHNGSVTLVEDGAVAAFLELERPSRDKNVGLDEANGLELVLKRLGVHAVDRIAIADRTWWEVRRPELEPALARIFGEVPIDVWHHHDCHAFSSLAASPWERAVCVTIDGKGDDLSAAAYIASLEEGIEEKLFEVPSRHSLGRLWWAVSEFCQFPGHHSAGKTMALAAYGKSQGLFDGVVFLDKAGGFRIEDRDSHPDTFRQIARIVSWIEARVDDAHALMTRADVAASLQGVTERIILHLVGRAVELGGLGEVALAGGVSLNGLANQAVSTRPDVEELYIVPCCDDRGLSLGAAALSASHVGSPLRSRRAALSPFLGVALELTEPPAPWRETSMDMASLAERIARGDVIAWCAGRDEAGPRALGHRSLLATPTLPGMRARLNAAKNREDFRPFGCAIAQEHVGDYFDMEGVSPYMLRIAKVRANQAERIPSALHVDGTSRIQTVARAGEDDTTLRPLIDALIELGHPPLVLNTSLNTRGAPLAHTVQDASEEALTLGADLLYVEGAIYERG